MPSFRAGGDAGGGWQGNTRGMNTQVGWKSWVEKLGGKVGWKSWVLRVSGWWGVLLTDALVNQSKVGWRWRSGRGGLSLKELRKGQLS